MSEVIRIKEDVYEEIEGLAYRNRISILEMSDIILKIGLKNKTFEKIYAESRGRNKEIEW